MFVDRGRSSPLHNKPALIQMPRLAHVYSLDFSMESVFRTQLSLHLKSRGNVHNAHTISCQRLSHENIRDTGARLGPDYFDLFN